MKRRGQFFIDLALPFGLRSAPGVFNSLADPFEWILQHNYRVADLLHHLDDFSHLAQPVGYGLLKLSKRHTTCITRHRHSFSSGQMRRSNNVYHVFRQRVELDMDMTSRLPQDKLSELQTIITIWVGKKFCTRRELESLV
jgi:hypothetical protein